MQGFQMMIYKVLELANTSLYFGQYHFTIFQFWLALFGVGVVAYIIRELFISDD